MKNMKELKQENKQPLVTYQKKTNYNNKKKHYSKTTTVLQAPDFRQAKKNVAGLNIRVSAQLSHKPGTAQHQNQL